MAKRQRERMSLAEMVKVSKGGKRPAPKKKAPVKKATRGEEMDRGVMNSATRLGKILLSGHDTTPDERN
jgi:hypothetical protein